MQHEVSNQGRFTVVALKGEVDMRHSPQARKIILASLEHARPVLVELTGVVKEEGATVLRSGETRDVITEWKFDRSKDQAVANKTLPELVGTEVRLQQEPPKNHSDPKRGSSHL